MGARRTGGDYLGFGSISFAEVLIRIYLQMFFLAQLAAGILNRSFFQFSCPLVRGHRTPDQNQLSKRLDEIIPFLSDENKCEDAAGLIAYIACKHVENCNKMVKKGVVPALFRIAGRATDDYDGSSFLALTCLVEGTDLTPTNAGFGSDELMTLMKSRNARQQELCVLILPILIRGDVQMLENLVLQGLVEVLLSPAILRADSERVRERAMELLMVLAVTNSPIIKKELKKFDSPFLHADATLKRSLKPFKQILTSDVLEYMSLGITSEHVSAVTTALLELFYFKKACWSKLFSSSVLSPYKVQHLSKSVYQNVLGGCSVCGYQRHHELARKSKQLRSEPPKMKCKELFLKINRFLDADYPEGGLPTPGNPNIDLLARKCCDAIHVLAELSASCGIFWKNYHIHLDFLDSSTNLRDEDPGGHTHLHSACFNADFLRAKYVVYKERDLACKRTYGHGCTPAHYCTYLGMLGLDEQIGTRFEILQLLAEVNPECIFVKNKDGCTPHDLLLEINKGKYMSHAKEMAQWLFERMTAQGWARHSMFGWFKISQVHC
jgi:hypothetical protein